MAMYGVLHRLYIKRKEEGRGQMSVERCVKEEEVAAVKTINTKDTVTSGKFNKQKTQELKQNSSEKNVQKVRQGNTRESS